MLAKGLGEAGKEESQRENKYLKGPLRDRVGTSETRERLPLKPKRQVTHGCTQGAILGLRWKSKDDNFHTTTQHGVLRLDTRPQAEVTPGHISQTNHVTSTKNLTTSHS